MSNSEQLVRDYYAAFNAGDMDAFLALLAEDVVHDINQGGREVGRAEFAAFMQRMNRHYREQLTDLVVMTSADGTRAAAEFVVHGEYLNTDEGLPEASGQRYQLPAGAFFELRNGKVARISNYYNLQDWIAQVVPGQGAI
ncbi:MAG: nuclear transport factor 2 family protein [Halioglobus sp.]|nr:nuclear transport factor 2 family protein [Halioglobus sp.]